MDSSKEQMVFEMANEIVEMVDMITPHFSDVDKKYVFPQTKTLEQLFNKAVELDYDADGEMTLKIFEVLNDYLNVSITDIKFTHGAVIIICKL